MGASPWVSEGEEEEDESGYQCDEACVHLGGPSRHGSGRGRRVAESVA